MAAALLAVPPPRGPGQVELQVQRSAIELALPRREYLPVPHEPIVRRFPVLAVMHDQAGLAELRQERCDPAVLAVIGVDQLVVANPTTSPLAVAVDHHAQEHAPR